VLATRHLAIGKSLIYGADQLTAPMNDVLAEISDQLEELRRYKEKYGELDEGTITEIQ
jgi:adenylate cyclase